MPVVGASWFLLFTFFRLILPRDGTARRNTEKWTAHMIPKKRRLNLCPDDRQLKVTRKRFGTVSRVARTRQQSPNVFLDLLNRLEHFLNRPSPIVSAEGFSRTAKLGLNRSKKRPNQLFFLINFFADLRHV